MNINMKPDHLTNDIGIFSYLLYYNIKSSWYPLFMKRLMALLCCAFFTSTVWAQYPMVISIHPLYLIAKKVTQGVETPQLLLENQSGHDVQLTPAHRKAIQESDLVIWMGKQHEAPLAKVLGGMPKAIPVLDSGLIQTLPLRTTRGAAIKGTIDTHVWLDPNNAVRIGFFIAALRSQQYPQYKNQYMNNARNFAREMLQTSQKMASHNTVRPYWAFHDAYQYLERPLNLRFAGALTDDPHIAATVSQIKYLNDTRPVTKMCLLAESAANPAQYRKLGNIVFQSVDETLAKYQDFVVAWQSLAKETQACVLNARK